MRPNILHFSSSQVGCRGAGAPGAESQLISNIQVETSRSSRPQASCMRAAQSMHRGPRAGRAALDIVEHQRDGPISQMRQVKSRGREGFLKPQSRTQCPSDPRPTRSLRGAVGREGRWLQTRAPHRSQIKGWLSACLRLLSPTPRCPPGRKGCYDWCQPTSEVALGKMVPKGKKAARLLPCPAATTRWCCFVGFEAVSRLFAT